MRRREVVALLCAAAWPHPAPAEEPGRTRRMAVLLNLEEDDPESRSRIAVLREALRELGRTEQDTLRIEFRWSAGKPERAGAIARELAALKPEVILVEGGTAISALLRETHSIPIVFLTAADPVGEIVSSIARPGGNATGFTRYESSMGAKWLELLKEAAPGIRRAMILVSDNLVAAGQLPMIETAGRSLNVELAFPHVRDARDIERAIEARTGAPDLGLVVLPSTVAVINRDLIVALAERHRLPAVYFNRAFVGSGGLMSYSTANEDLYRRAASYVDRILRGEKPSDLPVQAPTKFELVLNLKTARALGLAIPPTLLARADEVIE
jgi:putative ABC transport system substrate-binding protein